MSRLRDSARRHLEKVGHDMGQAVGQATVEPVPSEAPRPGAVGQGFPQNSAVFEPCPTVPPPKARDSGTKANLGDFRETARGTGGGTSAPIDDRIAVARLKEWHARLSKVDEFTTPPGWTLNDWLRLVDAACWLYENFASQAVRAHWSALDLFGVSPEGPGAGGIADRIGNARTLMLGEESAAWSFMDNRGRYKRGAADPSIVPLWELSE